jgi:signal peptidase I
MPKHRSVTVARHRSANGRVRPAPPPPRHRSRGQERAIPGWLEMVLLLAVALVLSLAIKTWFVQMFFVPSESMEPLLLVDDRILVQKVSYWAGDVERGDVVVFEDPGGWLQDAEEPQGLQKLLSAVGLYPTGGHLVKRVIGIGGDTVACCDSDGRVTVNKVALDESSYLPPGVDPSDQEFSVRVPEGRIWLMGDNRSNSEDSRFHRDLPGGGTVAVDRVVGKVWAVVWPLRRLDHLTTPATFEQDFDGSDPVARGSRPGVG